MIRYCWHGVCSVWPTQPALAIMQHAHWAQLENNWPTLQLTTPSASSKLPLGPDWSVAPVISQAPHGCRPMACLMALSRPVALSLFAALRLCILILLPWLQQTELNVECHVCVWPKSWMWG
ncbi:hypothetical protein BDZ91DRAFT_744139 [Kalaharituber pfeilii]|nr:hypothetical protein BDZ91DRAFT_744139 [Kalaharituber pfeilii]